MLGCCVDKTCTQKTCMQLPDGKTCEDCRFVRYCTGIGVTERNNGTCDWFPRRFKPIESGDTRRDSAA